MDLQVSDSDAGLFTSTPAPDATSEAAETVGPSGRGPFGVTMQRTKKVGNHMSPPTKQEKNKCRESEIVIQCQLKKKVYGSIGKK